MTSIAAHPLAWTVRFARSSIGAKVLVGLSGFALFGFVIAHMVGNFSMYMGPEAMNAYSHFMQSNKGFLWTLRFGLLVVTLVHILMTIRLTRMNRAARPHNYRQRRNLVSTLSSRTMIYSGLLLFAFIVYHLLHFTVGVTHPEDFNRMDPLGRHDAYSMFVLGFLRPEVTAAYIISMILLGLHLNHGAQSMFQSLGLSNPRHDRVVRPLSRGIAFLVVVGNISLPVSVMLGIIPKV